MQRYDLAERVKHTGLYSKNNGKPPKHPKWGVKYQLGLKEIAANLMKKLMARVRAELARLWKFSGESRRPSLDQGGGTGDGDTLQGEEYEWQNYDLLIQPETD